MPRGKTGGTATASKIAKVRRDTKITSIGKSTNADPNLTTTTKPRRSPRNHASSKTAAKEPPVSRRKKRPSIGKQITTKKDANVRSSAVLRATTKATVTSKAAAKPSQKSKDKAKTVVHFNHQTGGRPKGADPVQSSHSTPRLRPGREPKVSTKPKQRAIRDPGRKVPRYRTKRQSRKADDPQKSSATGSGKQTKVSSESLAELIPAPVDNTNTLHPTEPHVEPIQEDHYASGSRQLLTEDALRQLTSQLELIDPSNRNRSVKKIDVGLFGEESDDGSTQESDIDSQERFNRKLGYVPPLDEKTTRIIKAVIKNPARAEAMTGISPASEEFLEGLYDRNVCSDPSTRSDPREEEIRSISLNGFLQETQEQEKSHEELWRLDKAKCTPYSSEALYQRTLMISLIARHFLIYRFDESKEQIFDFSVEETWRCQPMPSRLHWDISRGRNSAARLLTQPKPDLAVSFKRKAVITDSMWRILPRTTKRLACFENPYSNASRVFHFFVVEAKRAMVDLDSPQALHQCLNDASQALHNMFEFFRDAGPEHEQIFYDKVRFFSVVANRKGIVVRIHRATRKPDGVDSLELVIPDRPDYRLEFEFREFQRIEHEFSRKRSLEVIKKVLKYATDDLLNMIKDAASKLVQNIAKESGLYDARREADFYSYGLPNMQGLRSSQRRSAFQSTIGQEVQRQLQSTNLGPNCLPSENSTAKTQRTSKQHHQPAISSPLAITTKKRGVNETELDEVEDMRAPKAPVRQRRRL